MRQTRHALRRDPGQIVPIIDRSLAAMEAGRPEEARRRAARRHQRGRRRDHES